MLGHLFSSIMIRSRYFPMIMLFKAYWFELDINEKRCWFDPKGIFGHLTGSVSMQHFGGFEYLLIYKE